MNPGSLASLLLLCALWPTTGSPAVQRGLSPKQIEEANSHFFIGGVVDEIPVALARSTGDVYLRLTVPSGSGYLKPVDAADELAMLMCDSRLVAVATARPRTVHMNAARSYTYSAWSFMLREVIVDRLLPGQAAHQVGSGIVVLTIGGDLRVGNRVIHAPSPHPDYKEGSEYLLILSRRVPETGALVADTPGFDLSSGAALGLDRQQQGHLSEGKQRDAFLESVRQGLALARLRRECSVGGGR